MHQGDGAPIRDAQTYPQMVHVRESEDDVVLSFADPTTGDRGLRHVGGHDDCRGADRVVMVQNLPNWHLVHYEPGVALLSPDKTCDAIGDRGQNADRTLPFHRVCLTPLKFPCDVRVDGQLGDYRNNPGG